MRAAITAAFAFGFNAGAPPQKQAAVTFADVPTFDAAIKALVSKKVVSRATVDDMDEKAKSRAFYVSRLAELEAVGRVKDYLVDNLKDKTSFQNFVKNLDKDELLKKAGWEKDGGWYWETVYRTNTMSAFNAGRAEAFDEYEPEFLEFIGIEDFRQTPVCASRSGIVKKRTDPFWKKNFPPLHFNCRSTVRPVYAEEAAAFGIKESAEVSFPDAPAKGFGHNPSAEWNEVTEGVKERYENLLDEIKVKNEFDGYLFFEDAPFDIKIDFAKDLKKITSSHRFLLLKYTKNMKVNLKSKIWPCYIPSENKIYLSIKNQKRKDALLGFKTNMTTFLHESGHWLDYNVIPGKSISDLMPELKNYLIEDSLRYINQLAPKEKRIHDFNFRMTQENRSFAKEIAEKIEKNEARAIISDLISAASQCKIIDGYYHKKDYWEKGKNIENETIANFFEAKGCGGKILSETKKAFPKTFGYFESVTRSLYD